MNTKIKSKVLTLIIALAMAFPFVAMVIVLFGDHIIPAGKELEYPTFTVLQQGEVNQLDVMSPEYSGAGLYLRAGELVKPLSEFTSTDWEGAGFKKKSKTGVYWKRNTNLCEFDSNDQLIYLSIDGSSEICIGKSESGPFVCLPTTRKEFEAVFGKPKRVRYFYERARWN